MGLQVIPIPLAIFFLIVCCNGTEGRIISKSSAVKTILTDYGDTYDCVDFYKQPAFDHPLLKNHTHDYKMTLTPFYEATSNDSEKGIKLVSTELEGDGCPIGTVPIRRVVESDSPTEKVSNGGVYNAVARKTGTKIYKGAGGILSIHNPKITGQQYSAARVKVQNGPESIEVGWRVDPTLYGDTQTRFFVRTVTGQAQCFNTLCPGFVLTSSSDLIEKPLIKGPPPEGKSFEILVLIVRDDQNNWRLALGDPLHEVGYWPSSIFKALEGVASYIEWGGEVYDPNPSPTAEMGAGKHIDVHDAYIRRLTEYITIAQFVDANDIEAFSDSNFYSSQQDYLDDYVRRFVQYGGPN